MNYKFWFYFRKAIFQGVVPIVTAFVTFYDIRSGYIYDIYIYTSTVLFVYGIFGTIIQFISDICSINVGFQEDFNVTNSRQIEAAVVSKQPMTVIKKVFKIKYSNSLFFSCLSSFCWWIGYDCPILIPHHVVNRINERVSDTDVIQSYVYGSFNSEYRLVNDFATMKESKQMEHIKHVIFDDYH